MKTGVMLRAKANCPSHSKADIRVRDLNFVIDEPAVRGGTNQGPTPTDTALAALLGCINVIGHKSAKRLGANIGHLEIDAECDFDRRGVTLEEEIETPFKAIRVTVRTNGTANDAVLAQVAEETDKYCPVTKLFRGAGTQLEVVWQRVGP
jgi:uncharacterized OsmC-like protein